MLSVEIIKRSFLGTINNLDVIFRITAFWAPVTFVVMLPLIVAGEGTDPYTTLPVPWMMTQDWYVGFLCAFVIAFVAAAGAAIVAIAWHRFLVLGEKPTKIVVWPKDWLLRRYFVSGLVLFIIPMTLILVVTLWAVFRNPAEIAAAQPQIGFSAFWQTLGSNFAIYFVFLIWGLKLPAIALAKPKHFEPLSTFTFGDSFYYTSKHFIQIVVLAVAFSFILTLVNSLQFSIFGANLISDFTSAIGGVLSSLLSYVLMVFTVGLLSELYKAIVPVSDEMQTA